MLALFSGGAWALTCANPSEGVLGRPGTPNPQHWLFWFGLGLGFRDIACYASAAEFAAVRLLCLLLHSQSLASLQNKCFGHEGEECRSFAAVHLFVLLDPFTMENAIKSLLQ